MSFIQQTIKCKSCGYEINVALGTFGFGMPQKCEKCDDNNFEFISHGWNAKEDTMNHNPIQSKIEEKIRQICTYYSELGEGTAGYDLSEEQFQKIFDLFSHSHKRWCEEVKKYWYYCGKWHDAGCKFIMSDAGVCNCKVKKNLSAIHSLHSSRNN